MQFRVNLEQRLISAYFNLVKISRNSCDTAIRKLSCRLKSKKFDGDIALGIAFDVN